MMPADVAAVIKSMLTVEALATMAAITTAWVISHLFGVGEAADILLLVAGVGALGWAAIEAAKKLEAFATTAYWARNDAELDRAAKYFAEAVAIAGVNAVLALLFKARPKEMFKGPTFKANAANAPKSPGLWYKPTITLDPALRAGEGFTTEWGDIVVSIRGSAADQKLVLLHEKVHSLLTPKFQPLREVRVTLSTNGYNKSYWLRYLEEALAETVAQLGVNGAKGLLTGIRFPVANGYVTITQLGTEAAGVALGPIIVGGMTYNVLFVNTNTQAQAAGQ